MPRLQRAKTCLQVVEKGTAYLISLQADDGGFGEGGDLKAVCKVPLVLVQTGHVEEAQRLLEWIKRGFTGDGGALAASHRTACWIAMAAQQSGRFDLSLPTVAHIRRCQGYGSGAFYEMENGRRASRLHLCGTAAGALALLACGGVGAARRAGTFLIHALEMQPRGSLFYACFDHRGRPHPAASDEPPDPDDVLDKSEAGQRYEILGLPEVVLARLYVATGDEKFLAAAKGYAHVAHRVEQDIWRSLAGCSSAWGEAILYRVTRRRRYLRFAERLVGHLIDHQREDGSWRPEGDEEEAAAQEAVIEATATALFTLVECLREVQ